ncbi:uncharacterized protein LOC133012085 [Limanda limanda]|uniref:uncharacterized protein LOC133012085 n=1 Tax=Limanda limanda TaxID=27771 RepID=UPI0029C91DA8|nr:uncharacterized protein LOC133012085 [Limanda limanda]
MLVLLLLLLGGAASVDADDYYSKHYGDTVSVRMWSHALSIKFIPEDTDSESVILWKLDDPSVPVDSRRSVSNGYLEIKNLTSKDNGVYKMMKNERVLKSWSVEVTVKYEYLELKSGEELRFTFPLVKEQCNIHFFSKKKEHDLTRFDTQLVRNGRMVETNSLCNGFEFVRPCGLEMEMHELCDGRFEVRDQYDEIALNVYVDWMADPFNLGYIGICVGAALGAVICCCCVKRCCCKGSKKKDSAAAEVPVAYNEYVQEPVALRPAQPTPHPVTYYTPPQPSQAPTGPLIHNPTIVNGPPAYSEGSAPAEPANAPTSSLLSDSGLQFELKGMQFPCASPLHAESTYNSVYTSNKLDFL